MMTIEGWNEIDARLDQLAKETFELRQRVAALEAGKLKLNKRQREYLEKLDRGSMSMNSSNATRTWLEARGLINVVSIDAPGNDYPSLRIEITSAGRAAMKSQ